ncbi:hypothetical protein EV44_g3395 [Erysiphe necator]|uniref:Uncharacterized protein n=1 Tax=Uncinula necator TaxID=52586 RepID=A0A0B1P479_UNCNE|nr:hypothetical protein EV44_g3395 [Erysiphe necator]
MVRMNNLQLESYMKGSVEDFEMKTVQLCKMLEESEKGSKEIKDSVKSNQDNLDSFKKVQIDQTKASQKIAENITESLLSLSRQFEASKQKSKKSEVKQLKAEKRLNLRLEIMQTSLSKQILEALSSNSNTSERTARELVRTSHDESRFRRSSLPPSKHGGSSSTNTSLQLADPQRSNLSILSPNHRTN